MNEEERNHLFDPEVVDVEEDDDDAALVNAAPSRGRPLLAIEDESEWYRRHGLPPNEGDGAYYEWYAGSNMSETNQNEARQRVEDAQNYQQQQHRRFFDQEQSSSNNHNEVLNLRQRQLEQWKSTNLILQVAEDQDIVCNLKDLATHSDTVFAMAASYPRFNNKEEDSVNKDPTTSTSTNESQDRNVPNMSLSLADYTKDVVEAFLKILKLCDDDKTETTSYDDLLEENHPEYIVQYCQLAHFLQCTEILEDGIIPILNRSVDSANCMSLCQLADQLHIPSLLEISMNHMMRSLGSLEESELWGDLTPELQNRIQAIRGILQSSNRRQLYFSSFTEYLAMFAEQVDYYQERLTEAKIQQGQHLTPRHSTRGWEYAQSKIQQQEERVRTLKLVLKEQKRMFGKKSLYCY